MLAAPVWLLEVHVDFAWVVVAANGIAGCWALAAHWSEPLRHRSLWWFTAFAQVAIFVQVAMGVAALEGRPLPQMHTFYGFLAIITVAIVYSYRQQVERHRYLLYGLGGLFIMGLGLRAVLLGAT